MASVSKRLATDETLMLLVDTVNNTETVKQAKAEIQAEGTAQVNNVRSTAEEMVKDINQVPKNTSDIAELNSNLSQLESNCRIDISYMANIGALTQIEDRYGAEIVDVRKGIYTIDFYSDGSDTYIGYKRNGEINNTDVLSGSGRKECVLNLEDGDSLVLWHDANVSKTFITSLSILTNAYIGYEVDKVNDSLAVIGKCKNLLNPTLQTTTQNGVTCTNNGDGTYTLNGTSTNLFQVMVGEVEIKGDQKYRTVGCPEGVINKEYCLIPYNVTDGVEFGKYDYGNGTINAPTKDITYRLYMFVASGVTVSNLVFKPMLTTNLNATYNDFVPYTGDGETLTEDVAELKNDLGGLSFSVSGTTLSITNGTNTWTLTQ